MIYYIATIIYSCFLYFIAKHTKIGDKCLTKTQIGLIASIPIFINGAFRYCVGADYLGYVKLFYLYKDGMVVNKEFIYEFINKSIIYLNLDCQWIFIIFSAVFVYFVMTTITRDSPIPCLSIYMLLATRNYFAYLNTSRQYCACAILLYSIQYINSRKFGNFLLCLLLACGFHYSCLIWLPMYFIANKKLNKKLIVFTTLILWYCKNMISNIGLELMALSKWAYHMSTSKHIANFSYTNIAIQLILVLLAILFLRKDNKQYNIYFNLQLFAFWIMIFSGTLPLIERLRYYFILPSICLIPMIIVSIKKSLNKYIVTCFLFVFFTIYMLYSVINDVYFVLPYRTVFGIY